jgi:hypothetical protein
MNILAIDPGPEQSSWVVWDGTKVLHKMHSANEEILASVIPSSTDASMAIEMIAPMGKNVGAEIFETCWWIGRFCQAWSPRTFVRIKRGEVKHHLGLSARGKDSDVRARIIQLFGGQDAIGSIHRPGPLYGVTTHMWSALAVALTAEGKIKQENLLAGLDVSEPAR